MEAILYVVNTMVILVKSIAILFVTKKEETEVLGAWSGRRRDSYLIIMICIK